MKGLGGMNYRDGELMGCKLYIIPNLLFAILRYYLTVGVGLEDRM